MTGRTLLLLLLAALGSTGSLAAEAGKRRPPTSVIQQPRPEHFVPPHPQGGILPQHLGPRPETHSGATGQLVRPDESRVRIIVRVISAAPGSEGKDPRLAAIEPNLETLPLRYGSFKLLDLKTFDLDWKTGAQMELPGSRSLMVTPRQLGADGRIRVHLELLGAHPEHARQLHTDYSVARGGTLVVGGLRLDASRPEAGVLLIAITQVLQP